jgi:hypothetical protein
MNESGQVSRKQGPFHLSKSKEILAFVMPSNPIEYKLMLDFGSKFTTVVPTWFVATSHTGYAVSGQEYIQTDWMTTMRAKYPRIRIAPRLFIEIPTIDFVHDYKEVSAAVAAGLSELNKEYHFDGFFLECPHYFAVIEALELLPHLFRTVKKALPRQARLYGEVPSEVKGHYGPDNSKIVKKSINELDRIYCSLYDLVDQASLSPIECFTVLQKWTDSLKITRKTIVGFPCFGIDFSPAGKVPVAWQDMIERFKTYKVTISWIQFAHEHAFFFSDGKRQHSVYYPTLLFLKERFEKSQEYKFTGIGLCGLVLGMPYFFDLL